MLIQVLSDLSKACGHGSVGDLGVTCAPLLLERLMTGGHQTGAEDAQTFTAWGAGTPDRFVFAALLGSCSAATLSQLMPSVLAVLHSCLQKDRDAQMRLDLLKLLDQLFESKEQQGAFAPHAGTVLTEVLLPALVWHVGKTAAAIRYSAIVATGSLLQAGLVTKPQLLDAMQSSDLLAALNSCLEEDYYADTRQASCLVMEHVLRVAGDGLSEEQRRAVYPEVITRVDLLLL